MATSTPSSPVGGPVNDGSNHAGELAGAVVGSGVVGALLAWMPRAALAFGGLAGLIVAVLIPAEVLIGGLLFIRNLTDPATAATASDAPAAGFNINAAIGAGLLVIVPVRLWLARQSVGALWMTIVAGLFLAWFGVALTIYGNDPSFTREIIRVLSIVALAGLAVNFIAAYPEQSRRLCWLIVLAGIIPMLEAVLQTGGVMSVGQTAAGRARGTFTQANAAGIAFALLSIVSVWLALTASRGRRRLPVALAAGFLLALLGTKSLGGLANGFIGLLVLTSMMPVARRLSQVARIGAVLLVIVFVVSPLGDERISELSTTQSPSQVAMTGATSNSLDWRFYNWSQFIEAWKEHPVFGNGLGTTDEVITPLGLPPHSDAIRTLTEAGVVGTLIFAALGALLLRAIWRRTRGPDARANIAVPAFAVLIGALVHALDQTVSFNTAQMYMIAVLVGGALALPAWPKNARAAHVVT